MKHKDGVWMEIFILAAMIPLGIDNVFAGRSWRVGALVNLIGLIVLWRQEGRIRDFWRWWDTSRELDGERAQNLAWMKSAIRDRKQIEMLAGKTDK